ncbi:S41 family peptidase [Luteimonas sp. e5]
MRVSALPLLLSLLAAPFALHAQERPPVPARGAPAEPAQDEAPAAAEQAADAATESPGRQVPLAEIRRFVSVYNAIREAYVEPVDDQRLMHAALRGLLLDLDPHSVYFDRDAARDFNQDAAGAYEGVGLQLQQEPGPVLKVIAPIEGGPADRAGLRSGDLITAIDGKPISIDDGSAPLRGEAGTRVRLSVHREGRDGAFDVTLVRERIQLQSVRVRLLEPGYGYVRISSFQAGTADDFARGVDELKQQAGGRLQGVLIDLRANPGGLLNAAVQIADDLLDDGVIVSTRGRQRGGDASYSATRGDLSDGAALVVLIDAGSASASEVLAGALRDHGRARIVGSRSFGKGSVQTLLPLDNGDAVKLTTARYYTPSGRSIQGVGIGPDVVLHGEEGAAPAEVREAALRGHLVGEEEGEPMAGEHAGENLPGEAPLKAALAELKRIARQPAASKPPPVTVKPALPPVPVPPPPRD